ncbi:MAG: NAD(P)H-dependent glycerol-3-phosphate dehydrogenase, partial [Planctomycetota bacterium]|nr:NAD(P)H-dependent glycerol-3-phosphate dehydrogenase [Planctomycetota bacterium]
RTFAMESQCWGNDMWMSCTGPTRNRALGALIGGGMTLERATAEMARQRKTVEGVQTVHAMAPLFERFPDELPILRVARRILLEDAPAQELFDALMDR